MSPGLVTSLLLLAVAEPGLGAAQTIIAVKFRTTVTA